MDFNGIRSSGLLVACFFIGHFALYFQIVAGTTADNVTWENCSNTSILEGGPLSAPEPIAFCSVSLGHDNISIDYFLSFDYGGTFSINSSSGIIYQEIEVDREQINSYAMNIYALFLEGRNSTVNFIVTVKDINDNAPVILGNETIIKTITFSDIQSKNTSFYQVIAMDPDIGENGKLIFTMTYTRHYIRELGEIVMLQIIVSDNGDPKLATSVTRRIDILGRCPQQLHTINASNGLITSYLLCEVELLSNKANLVVGGSVTLTCQHVSNIRNAQFEFWGGVTNISFFSMESVLNLTNLSFDLKGHHTCRIKTTIGELQSNSIQLVVLSKLKIDLCNIYSMFWSAIFHTQHDQPLSNLWYCVGES